MLPAVTPLLHGEITAIKAFYDIPRDQRILGILGTQYLSASSIGFTLRFLLAKVATQYPLWPRRSVNTTGP